MDPMLYLMAFHVMERELQERQLRRLRRSGSPVAERRSWRTVARAALARRPRRAAAPAPATGSLAPCCPA